MIRRKTGVVLILLVVMAAVQYVPDVLAHALSNLGMIALRNALLVGTARLEINPEPDSYSLYNAAAESRVVSQISTFQHAADLDKNSSTIRWGLGRLALATGDAETAAEALKPIAGDAKHNPLLYQDILSAFSYGGRPDQVIAQYEAIPPLHRTEVTSDTVAVAYLDTMGQQGLGKLMQLRPGDLYANYHLWQESRQSGDLTSAFAYDETLTHFSLGAISPRNERLLDYAAEVIPKLLEEELWDRDMTLDVVSFLVMRYSQVAAVERLLERLTERYPTEPDWSFYLAELYHRQGDLGRAKTVYKRVLAADPKYAQAYLRLGMLAEADPQEKAQAAARWFAQYRELAPDDLLGLKRLTQVCVALEEVGAENESCLEAAKRVTGICQSTGYHSPAATLREGLETRTDDRCVVAELLRVPAESVEFGPNLVQNGGFEEWAYGDPEWWIWTNMATGDPWNEGLFTGHAEPLLAWEGRAGRVDGFWMRHDDSLAQARSGFWYRTQQAESHHGIALKPDRLYLLSFYYRTDRLSDLAVILWVSDDANVLFKDGHRFPPTTGGWRRSVVIGWNSSKKTEFIRPVLLNFGAGSVWFDDVILREIKLASGIPADNRETRFWVLDGVNEDWYRRED